MLLGGVLTSYVGWSWIFFVNVPVGVGRDRAHPRYCARAGPNSSTATSTSRRRVDHLRLMLLVYAMTRATSDGWGSPTTLALLAGSVALVLAFVAIEPRSPAPLLPLRIFRLRTLTAANATMAVVGAVTFAKFFLLTLYLQDVLGLLGGPAPAPPSRPSR